jgi:4-amino-4-deoxy-L-arabinose transferase-like glycosyltransferase
MQSRLKQNLFTICLVCFVIFLAIFRIHNSWSFNPFWGYDGGGHVDYIMSLAQSNHFPSIKDNYIAWHEPLYYFVFAGIAKIVLSFTEDIKPVLKTLGLAQVALSFCVSYLIYRILKQTTKQKIAILFSFVLLNLLPAMNEASTFLTNELLNYFFIFLVITLLIDHARSNQPTIARVLVLGLVCGLALNTKITAIIPTVFVILFLIFDIFKKRTIKPFTRLTIFILTALVLITPWQIYRSQNVLAAPSINNQDFLQPMPFELDERIDKYTWFDTDVFKFPYWYSGGRTFWSMLYADSFYDYYGMIENDDLIATAPQSKLVRTTVSDTYVTQRNFVLTSKLVWLAIAPAAILMSGIVAMLILLFTKRERLMPIFGLAVTFSFLAALLYFSYRYHYFDMGIVKSIFIFPFYLFPIAYGFAFAKKIFGQKKRWVTSVLGLVTAPYVIYVAQAFWIQNFNY